MDLSYKIRPQGFLKTSLAPVIVHENNVTELREMAFSLCPSWSKEFPYKWSSYNARMERPKMTKDYKPVLDQAGKPISEYIFEIPTWRDSFRQAKTCLVPMNAAIESSYFGTHAGQIVKFQKKNKETFFAAGLWSQWIDQSTGEVKDTFTLITDDPYEFFFQAGHDRSIFVLKPEAQTEWLNNKSFTPKERFEFLRKNRVSLDWDVETEREMVKGWEKKAPTKEEVSEIRVWRGA